MAMKRKCEFEMDESFAPSAKQLKCVPFPNYVLDDDVAMSDASSDASPIMGFNEAYHTRLASDASTSSSVSSTSSDSPVAFGSESPNDLIQNVGLLQPSNGFTHHGTNCSQIPKLRMACAAGANGRRTMWSFCEDCGSISMVDSD